MTINHLLPIKKWLIYLLFSVRLVPIVHSTYFDTFRNYDPTYDPTFDPNYNQENQTLSPFESIQDENYAQNRDYLLNHFNQLNYDSREPFDYSNRQQFKRVQQFYHQNETNLNERPNLFTKRIALSSLANIFGGSSNSDEKKDEKLTTENQTDIKSIKENSTSSIDENLNKNSTNDATSQSAYLKNHSQQNDKEFETLNRLINLSRNYENWSDHLKNTYAHRNDLINLLRLNESNLSDSNYPQLNSSTVEPDHQLSKSKNLFVFSPEYASKTLFDNNHFGFKPNNFLSSLLANSNGEHEYFSRFNKLPLNSAETITEASDHSSEYDEYINNNNEDDENPTKLIDNRNENNAKRRKQSSFRNQMQNRPKQTGQRARPKSKSRKNYDNYQFNKNVVQNGFRPVDNRLLKEQSQISSSSTTGTKRNSMRKNKTNVSNDLSLVETTQQNQNDSKKRANNQTTFEQEFNQLSVSNLPYTSVKQPIYRFPTNHYGKRLINDILNSQPNVRKNLVSTTSSTNKNVVNNNNESTDHLDEENNETGKEEILNEQDKQLVTDKTKEVNEKNDDDFLNEMSLNEYDSNNQDLDKNNANDSANQQQQLTHQTNAQLNQHQNNQQTDAQLNNQQSITNQLNQPEIESNENDSIENENDLSNNNNSSVNSTKESDNLDTTGKTKLMTNELNKSTKQPDKTSGKLKPTKKTNPNWKSFVDSNYKHYKIFDKYSKSSGGLNNFNFDQNLPTMNNFLSNENFKINLNGGSKSEFMDDDFSNANLFPNVQYNKPTSSFSNLYYPMIKKKPYFSSSTYPFPGFSTNPLNGMLFDKLNIVDSYSISPIDKLAPSSLTSSMPLKTIDKNPLDNKFYNLDNKLHHLNSKYSLNSLTPPPFIPPLPHPLETAKYYEPKGHYDSKYHNGMNHWQSALTGFLFGVVPFSFLLASMAPTISAITSGSAAAAALGRRRRSVEADQLINRTITQSVKLNLINQTKLDENLICLNKLAKIIDLLNELNNIKDNEKHEKSINYFNQLMDLQKQCEFNFKPIDLYREVKRILNSNELNIRNDKMLKRLKDSYYSYNSGNSKMNLFDTILNFIFSLDLIKDRTMSNLYRTNQTNSYFTNDLFSTHPVNFFHQREGKCLQEMMCKIILSPKFEKSIFSIGASILANITPNNLANKYGLDVLVIGLKKGNKCTIGQSYC